MCQYYVQCHDIVVLVSIATVDSTRARRRARGPSVLYNVMTLYNVMCHGQYSTMIMHGIVGLA